MSVSSYVRKQTITNSDYNQIAKLPYKDQIEIFKLRNIKLYRLKDFEENPQRYKESDIRNAKKDFQKVYNTRTKKNMEDELKQIQEAENRLEVRAKLRSANNLKKR